MFRMLPRIAGETCTGTTGSASFSLPWQAIADSAASAESVQRVVVRMATESP